VTPENLIKGSMQVFSFPMEEDLSTSIGGIKVEKVESLIEDMPVCFKNYPREERTGGRHCPRSWKRCVQTR